MLSFFLALNYLPLAKLSALMFTCPLFATVGAALVLREKIGPARLGSLAVGFSGALLVMRPGLEEMTTGIWLAIVAAATWGAALVLIKLQSRTESSLTIAIYAANLLLPFSLAAALFFWAWPSLVSLVWLAGIGLLGTIGQIALGNAFRRADASVVLPFDFTKLIWAALVGYIMFGEVPDIWTWVGGAVIFASSLFIAYRERAQRQAVVAAV
jgi:drug/metabolite transporter (DMT)-like permease